MKSTPSIALTLFLVIAAGAAAGARVDDFGQLADIDRVRTLYVAAAYEEALAAMPPVNGEPVRTDVEQYRALCLLALGREDEAVAAVERLVRDHPTFVPPAGETAPRMQAMFATARTKMIPDLAKRSYADAKVAYEAKNRETAMAGFKRALQLIDTLPEPERPALADLRLLAAEFLELSAVVPPAPPPVAPIAEKPAPKVAPVGDYVAPMAVREEMPPWVPPDSAALRTEYLGLLRVFIGEDGRVQSATIVKSSHPAYDTLALRAAKSWMYRPATRGGQAVASQKEIQIRLIPR
jgi:TonB family protein